MRKIFFLLTSVLTVLLFVNTASASVTCTPIYGGGETCVTKGELDIEKKINHPDASKGGIENFVDNLSITDPRFHSGDQITFKLTVTNTGDAMLNTVEVKDILPSYVTFVAGPGNFDSNSKTLTYTLKDLKAKESRTNILTVKVVDDASLPEGTACSVNQSFVSSEGMSDQDNSQFCVEKKAQVTKGGLPVKPAPPVTQAPPTGPEMWALVGLIPAGLGGLLLRRKSMKLKFGGDK